MKKDLTKTQLYESVKILVDTREPLIHLPQIKIYTVFSVAFQYVLYHSTKSFGHYIIRIQDPIFAGKLAKFAKDPSSRKFMDRLIDMGKVVYGKSTLYMDTFHVGSWHRTKDLNISEIQGVLIVKASPVRNTEDSTLDLLSEDFYYGPFVGNVPKLIVIDPVDTYDGFYKLNFPMVQELLSKENDD